MIETALCLLHKDRNAPTETRSLTGIESGGSEGSVWTWTDAKLDEYAPWGERDANKLGPEEHHQSIPPGSQLGHLWG